MMPQAVTIAVRHLSCVSSGLLQRPYPSDSWIIIMQEPSVPQRASLRIKGIASDGTSVADELRNGQIVLKDSKDTSIWGPFPRYQDAPEPKPREMPSGVPTVPCISACRAMILITCRKCMCMGIIRMHRM